MTKQMSQKQIAKAEEKYLRGVEAELKAEQDADYTQQIAEDAEREVQAEFAEKQEVQRKKLITLMCKKRGEIRNICHRHETSKDKRVKEQYHSDLEAAKTLLKDYRDILIESLQ